MSVKHIPTSIKNKNLNKLQLEEALKRLDEKEMQIAEQAGQIDLLKGCIMDMAETLYGESE